jgi:hypothetical protein
LTLDAEKNGHFYETMPPTQNLNTTGGRFLGGGGPGRRIPAVFLQDGAENLNVFYFFTDYSIDLLGPFARGDEFLHGVIENDGILLPIKSIPYQIFFRRVGFNQRVDPRHRHGLGLQKILEIQVFARVFDFKNQFMQMSGNAFLHPGKKLPVSHLHVGQSMQKLAQIPPGTLFGHPTVKQFPILFHVQGDFEEILQRKTNHDSTSGFWQMKEIIKQIREKCDGCSSVILQWEKPSADFACRGKGKFAILFPVDSIRANTSGAQENAMDDNRQRAGKALFDLVARKDSSVFQSRMVFEQALSAAGVQGVDEIKALGAGLEDRLPWELRKFPDSTISRPEMERLKSRLCAKYGLESDLAQWALTTWVATMGLTIQAGAAPASPAASASSGSLRPPLSPSSASAPSNPSNSSLPGSASAASIPTGTAGSTGSVPGGIPTTPIGIEFMLDDHGLIRVAQAWNFDAPGTSDPPQKWADWVKPPAPSLVPLPAGSPAAAGSAVSGMASTSSGSPVAPASSPEKNTAKPVAGSFPGSGARMGAVPGPGPKTPVARGGLAMRPPAPASPGSPVSPGAKSSAGPGRTLGVVPAGPPPTGAQEQYDLALAYLKGTTGRTNVPEALKLLQMAAGQGFLPAQYKVGEVYMKGWGVKEDLGEAVKWFRRAAEKGYAEAQVQLGSLYQIGFGVEMNLDEARRWLGLAAKQGNQEAENLLKQINQG